MKSTWTIARREYFAYFSSPAAYIVIFLILMFCGVYFYFFDLLLAFQQQFVPQIGRILGLLGTLLMLATPALTARLMAEEQRMGTIELLLTAPVRDWELVVGKWLGVFLFMLTIVAISIVYPLILNQFVDPGIDQGPVFSAYLGLILLCGALSAVGVAISALFSSQIAAFITTMGFLILAWWIIGPISQVAAAGSILAQIVTALDWGAHFFNNLLRGVIDLADVIFYLSVTALALLIGTMTVEMRRWR